MPRQREEDGRSEHGRGRDDRDDRRARRLPVEREEAGGGDEEVAGKREWHPGLLDEEDSEEAGIVPLLEEVLRGHEQVR